MTVDTEDSELEQKAALVCDLLIVNYGDKITGRRLTPVSELVYTILSQNTTSVNTKRAYDNLVEAYPTWEKVMRASTKKLARVIRPSGFYRVKANRIKATLKGIKKRVGELNLELLADMEIEEAKEWLTSLKGVGAKTAAIVLLFCFRKPVIPVDTHVYRVTQRLGLAPKDHSRDSAQIHLESIIPRYCVYSLNRNLVRHGREVCKARNPRCEECFLNMYCDYYQNR